MPGIRTFFQILTKLQISWSIFDQFGQLLPFVFYWFLLVGDPFLETDLDLRAMLFKLQCKEGHVLGTRVDSGL